MVASIFDASGGRLSLRQWQGRAISDRLLLEAPFAVGFSPASLSRKQFTAGQSVSGDRNASPLGNLTNCDR